MKNKDLIKNYYDQLAELQKKFWFERLDLKEYCIIYDAINEGEVCDYEMQHLVPMLRKYKIKNLLNE